MLISEHLYIIYGMGIVDILDFWSRLNMYVAVFVCNIVIWWVYVAANICGNVILFTLQNASGICYLHGTCRMVLVHHPLKSKHSSLKVLLQGQLLRFWC